MNKKNEDTRKPLVNLDKGSYKGYRYWSNSCGDLFRGDEDIDTDGLPAQLKRAFEDLWCEDEFGLCCYLVEWNGQYGISLEAGYDDCLARDYGMTREVLDAFAGKVGLMFSDAMPGVQFLFGRGIQEWSDGSFDTLVMAFIPWDTDKETFRRIGKYMGDNAYANLTHERQTENPAVKEGDRIHIIYMDNEPHYCGKSGTVSYIDGNGFIHGTWGGCAVNAEKDDYELVSDQ